ncbi:hypothetical protein AB5I41_10240 [Sphingomonas sp. MMS24-JH45]
MKVIQDKTTADDGTAIRGIHAKGHAHRQRHARSDGQPSARIGAGPVRRCGQL